MAITLLSFKWIYDLKLIAYNVLQLMNFFIPILNKSLQISLFNLV